jgi:hypothetical protein
MKTVIVALSAILLWLASTGVADEVPIGKCNVTMDFKGSSINFTQSDTAVKDDTIIDMTVLVDEATNTPAFIYIMDFPTTNSPSSIEDGLRSAMKALCGRVSIEKTNDSYISTGLFVSGGQNSWGVAFPLDLNGTQFKRLFFVICCFKNESLNERLIKDMKIENVKCP